MVVDQSTPSANPLGLNGFEFVEFTSPDPAAMDAQFVALGFTPTHRHPTKNVTRYKQGRINLMLNRDEAGRVAAFTYAISNTFGFGGLNAVLAFKK